MQEFIKLEHVSHSYTNAEGDAVEALQDISLTVAQGEFVAIIGSNGSGKSTLARHFNALLPPTQGQCYIDGLDASLPENIWKVRQIVGMVFQNPDNQIVATIVEEDIAFGPENLGLPAAEIQARVTEALALVDMQDYRLHAPHLLSGGQKQRIAIAGVLAMCPRCLVLDEATAMLDPRGRQEVLGTVRKLHQEEGITVIHITHFMEEAALADRVLVMEQGNIVAEGRPQEIFSQVELLKSVGLDVPVAAEVAYQLRKQGLNVPAGITTDEELVVALCR